MIMTSLIRDNMKKTLPIKKNNEFLRVYKRGKFYVGKFIVLYVLINKLSINRLGITASKKFGNSVKRNRIRRLIKESYRGYEDFIKEGCDFVFVARNTTTIASFLEIKKEMKFLFKRMSVFNQEKWDCQKGF